MYEHEQSMNHISLKIEVIQSHTLWRDMFQPIPGFISCVGVTGRWERMAVSCTVT